MKEITPYRWQRYKHGFAIVTLAVSPNESGNSEILEYYSGSGWTTHGNIDEVPVEGLQSWKLAARKALEYGFSIVGGCWTVSIYKIEGLIATDTNATVVGYAVLRAFLDKTGYQLSSNEIER